MKTAALIAVAVALIIATPVFVSDEVYGRGPSPGEQLGLVLPTWERDGYSATDTRGAMHEIADVGANWVQIVPTWYQQGRSSAEISPTDSSVADADLRLAVGLARSEGLQVLLKPHVDVLDGSDRSLIDPTDRDAWFRSYREFITHHADLAQELGVEQFAVGTELSALSPDRDRWLSVIEAVRSRYGGQLLYAANHSEFAAVAFWDAVDLVGIDGYWALSSQPTTDRAQLDRALTAIRDDLAAFSARVDRRILFTEAGYPSQVGAATAPWNAHQSRQPAQAEQSAAYEALLATFHGQPWWAGVFWWTWAIQHRHEIDPPESLDYSVRGKLAESVLRRWWVA